MKDFRVSNELNAHNVDAIAKLLVQPRLWVPDGDYPAHLEWSDRAIAKVESERMRGMVAWWGWDEVADAMYQRDPRDPTRVEIKNFSVEPSARGRGLASFLLHQVVAEASVDFPGATAVIADTKRTNFEVIAFALRQGFTILDQAVLDGPMAHNGIEDVVLYKELEVSNS